MTAYSAATTSTPANRFARAIATGSAPQTSEIAPRPRGLRALVQAHPLVAYFGIAFAGTWLAISPLVLGPNGIGLLPVVLPDVLSILIFFGATYAGPTVAAFAASWLEGGSAGVRRFAAGYTRWRVAPQWWLLAPVIFPALWLVGYSVVLDGAPLLNLVRTPQVLLTVFLPQVALLFVVALGEEAGWRGVALPRLQQALGPVHATLVLGLLHGLWHLPVFFVAGFLGPFTISGFTTFLVVAIFGTFLYTWVANHTRYSILLATLVHAGSNAATNLLTQLTELPYVGDPRVEWLLQENRLNVLIFGAAALTLLVTTRGRLGYQEPSESER
ncbi:MAG TPA: CPBP family intramembrane glutamic endopeptidase [Chloroflexota bacterium]|nr:CPBP family intramembrane glutamic endopeptidase [Chloroflexota bacterium]